ncbi:MAG: homoserine kinase [Hyphomicrobiales bacterium]|nr:MAG: homoserine kinase [Hyphomicrobiales bacterium]
MAVYTEVSVEDLESFVAGYDIGALMSYKGIAEGVENSNYLLHTEAGYYILTLYEKRVDPDDLPFFLGLMEHLAAAGFSCPLPVRARDGEALGTLSDRPAAIVTFLDGMATRKPRIEHCAALGEGLAQMHLAGQDFAMARPNSLSVAGWVELAEATAERADEVSIGLGTEIAEEVAAIRTLWPQDLPSGIIHADLFPDNVFFLGTNLSGFIDFYFACTDSFAYDVAICLNAWCFETDLSFNVTKARALLAGYTSVRPFSDAEFNALPLLARGAALRFLLSRLYDWLNVPEGALVTPKDPREYLRKLRFHRTVESASAYGLER